MMDNTTRRVGPTPETMDELAGKYLTFNLGGEDYGLQILKVQEIIKMLEITRVPRTPVFIKGVVNLRGRVIPVVDLRLKFGMETAEPTEKTCVIVVQIEHETPLVTMGIVVDEVCEVLDIPAADITPSPAMGAAVDTSFILAMAKAEGSVKILLDIDKILSHEEIEAVESVE